VLFAALAASALCRALDPGAALGSLLVASILARFGGAVLAPLMLGARTFLGHAPAERAALLGLSFGLRLAVLSPRSPPSARFGALWGRRAGRVAAAVPRAARARRGMVAPRAASRLRRARAQGHARGVGSRCWARAAPPTG
jgi:hypothetical protein